MQPRVPTASELADLVELFHKVGMTTDEVLDFIRQCYIVMFDYVANHAGGYIGKVMYLVGPYDPSQVFAFKWLEEGKLEMLGFQYIGTIPE